MPSSEMARLRTVVASKCAKEVAGAAVQQYYYAMMHRPSRTGVLSGSGKPVLFIIGTEDVAAPLKDVLPQTYLPACSYIHILDNVGHMGMWEAAEKVNTAIKNFVH